ncbi:MAG: alpha/beta hydrolase, partial [Oricola sp.]|nr:alpha/beta hydrolase [Oricola sp.]
MPLDSKGNPAPGAADRPEPSAAPRLLTRLMWAAVRHVFQAFLQLPDALLATVADRLGRRGPDGIRPVDPRAFLHAAFVRRFGAGMPVFDPATARKPRLLSLWLLEGRPGRMQSVRDITFPGPDRRLRARIYTPPDCPADAPALIFMHFGGCVTGDLDTCHTACTIIARHAHCKVCSIEYRLAPEHRFPAALRDVIAAFQWLRREAPTLGIDPGRIGIGGDSAGGYLAAAACLALDAERAPKPKMQLLMYPVLDMDRRALPETPFDNCYPLTRADMTWFADLYLRRPEDAVNPLCSVSRAETVEGMPPTILIQARHDLLFDEGNRFAERLRDAGI